MALQLQRTLSVKTLMVIGGMTAFVFATQVFAMITSEKIAAALELIDITSPPLVKELPADYIAAPTLESPGDNLHIQGSGLTYDWSDVVGANHYVYQNFTVTTDGSCNYDDMQTDTVYGSSQTDSRDETSSLLTLCWRVKAVGMTGNESQWSEVWKTVIDNEAPIVHSTAPSGVVGGTSVEMTGNITDNSASPNFYYGYQVLDKDKNAAMGAAVYDRVASSSTVRGDLDIAGYTSGTYFLRIWAQDQAGNRSPVDEASFVIDHDGPIVTINLSSSVAPSASTPILLHGTAVDTAQIQSLKLLIDDVFLADLALDTEGKWQYALPKGLPEKDYTFSVVATDYYDNESHKEMSPASVLLLKVGPYVPPIDGTIAPGLTDGLDEPFVLPSIAGAMPSVVSDPYLHPGGDILGAVDKTSPTVDQNMKSVAIAATESGWKLFGMLWYWWLLLAVLLTAASWRITKLVQRQNAQI